MTGRYGVGGWGGHVDPAGRSAGLAARLHIPEEVVVTDRSPRGYPPKLRRHFIFKIVFPSSPTISQNTIDTRFLRLYNQKKNSVADFVSHPSQWKN